MCRCCFVGLDLGDTVVASVASARLYPNFEQASAILGGVIQGSLDGVTYTNLATVTGRVQEGWNDITLNPGAAVYRFLRYLGPAGSKCEVKHGH